MPLPLDAPCRHPCGLHPAGMKEGFHRIMKVAASPRPRILEPRLRLPVRPFSPAYTGPNMASADFYDPFKALYGVFRCHRQGSQTSPDKNSRLPATSAAFTASSLAGYDPALFSSEFTYFIKPASLKYLSAPGCKGTSELPPRAFWGESCLNPASMVLASSKYFQNAFVIS